MGKLCRHIQGDFIKTQAQASLELGYNDGSTKEEVEEEKEESRFLLR